jgi:hypothetical protein
MLHRTGTRKLHTAKQLNPRYANGKQDSSEDNQAADRSTVEQVGPN